MTSGPSDIVRRSPHRIDFERWEAYLSQRRHVQRVARIACEPLSSDDYADLVMPISEWL
jgi:hypothetical protein